MIRRPKNHKNRAQLVKPGPAAPPSITTPDALRLKIEPTADCCRYDSIRKVA